MAVHLLVLFLVAPVCLAHRPVPDDSAVAPVVRGEPEHLTLEWGSSIRYVPGGDLRGVVVLVHGSVGEDESAVQAAEIFLGRWTMFADQERFVLLAPVFDQENFGGHAGPGGGYRGLFGRRVGADAFVNAIIEETRKELPGLPEKFALYGHSAGGQFVSRYLVMHPDRVAAAVISAPGTFAFPDPEIAWTNGMKPLRRRMRWSDDEPWEMVEVAPDPLGWARAARIPVTVVVGSRDTGEINPVPGNPGRTRPERARAWVQAMSEHARTHGGTPRVRYAEVAGVAHNSAQLTPACQRAMLECLAGSRGGVDDDG